MKTPLICILSFVIFFSFGCDYFKNRSTKKQWLELPNDTIIHEQYRGRPDMFSSTGIRLYDEQTYYYYYGGCTGGGHDSGLYRIQNDTIYFQSILEHTIDSTNRHRHLDKISPITGEKYLLSGNKIYYDLIDGDYHPNGYWQKRGLEWEPYIDSLPEKFRGL